MSVVRTLRLTVPPAGTLAVIDTVAARRLRRASSAIPFRESLPRTERVLPAGTEIEFGGLYQIQRESFLGLGQVLIAASLGKQYGFTDIDGKSPRPLTIADV